MASFLLLVLAKAGVNFGTDVLRCQLVHFLDINIDSPEHLLLIVDFILGLLDARVEALDKTVRGQARRVLPQEVLLFLGNSQRYLGQSLPPVLAYLACDEFSHSYVLDT